MTFLRRLLARGGDARRPHRHVRRPGDGTAPGWDAISDACTRIHGPEEPRHWGTIRRWRQGGPDPLDGLSAHRADGPPPHWHFVGYGLSELWEKESDDAAVSGWGIELTFRLLRAAADQDPPTWPVTLLQDLARYVYRSHNVLRPGDHTSFDGPIGQADTALSAFLFAEDPELGTIETPNGVVTFVQLVGVHDDEYRLASEWDTHRVLEILARRDPRLVTDLARPSILTDPAVVSEVAAGRQTDGSWMGGLNDAAFTWRTAGTELEVLLDAGMRDRLVTMLEGRIGHGRPLWIQGFDRSLEIHPGADDVEVVDRQLRLHVSDATARSLAAALRSARRSAEIAELPRVRWIVSE